MVDGVHGKDGHIAHTHVVVVPNNDSVIAPHLFQLMEDKTASGLLSIRCIAINNTAQVIKYITH